MTKKPKVSVIIVNWNGAAHLRWCLPSLGSQTHEPLEIIVVDNRSTDDSAEVASKFGVRWLLLEENIGLAPALNRGAEIATGELLLFVNNDMRFDPKFVAALIEPLERDAEVFATDGMQYNWDGTARAHLAARLIRVKAPTNNVVTQLVPGLFFYQQESIQATPVFTGSAACMMARRTLFEKIGGFDNRLPLGYEDAEICWRAWVQGFKTLYVPTAICWHRVGGSVKSLEAARFTFRGILQGKLLLATKLLPLRYIALTWLMSAAGLMKDIGRLRWSFASDRISVLVHMAGLSGQLLRERWKLFTDARTSPSEQLDFFVRLGDDQARVRGK